MNQLELSVNDIIQKLDGNGINISQISDGFHNFEELYEFRKLYNALLFNQWAKVGKYDVVKSYRHSDGNFCFKSNREWFIVVAQTPFGQISNHYQGDSWDLFNLPEVFKAPDFDGHTAKDVLVRLKNTIELENKTNKIT